MKLSVYLANLRFDTCLVCTFPVIMCFSRAPVIGTTAKQHLEIYSVSSCAYASAKLVFSYGVNFFPTDLKTLKTKAVSCFLLLCVLEIVGS